MHTDDEVTYMYFNNIHERREIRRRRVTRHIYYCNIISLKHLFN